MIREGGLVGLPTETVYGIACDAMNAEAVLRVYALKGRPAENPLIVHLASPDWVDRVAASFPKQAEALAERFWPGPLTLVLRKAESVPSAVTAGLPTVAVRVPDHDLTRAVIDAAGAPIAAPSANTFMRLSPTSVMDFEPEILSGLDLVIDDVPSRIGIESTVLDVTTSPPRILRPGGICRREIESVVGVVDSGSPERKSPGMYSRHYAPRAELVIVPKVHEGAAALILTGPTRGPQILMPGEEREYAAQLYHALHTLDRREPQRIEVEAPPTEWEAVWDRLRKAATPE